MAGNRTDWYGEVELLGESDAAQFYALLETITVRTGQDRALEDILCEEAAGYFAGSISAEQAAQNIQSQRGHLSAGAIWKLDSFQNSGRVVRCR